MLAMKTNAEIIFFSCLGASRNPQINSMTRDASVRMAAAGHQRTDLVSIEKLCDIDIDLRPKTPERKSDHLQTGIS